MNTIIAGTRCYASPALVVAAVAASGFRITAVLSDGTPGVAKCGEAWALDQDLPLQCYPVGTAHTTTLVQHAAALIAIWDGHDRTTAHLIDQAISAGLRVSIFHPPLYPALWADAAIAAAEAASRVYNYRYTNLWHARSTVTAAAHNRQIDQTVATQTLAEVQRLLDQARVRLLETRQWAQQAARQAGRGWPVADPLSSASFLAV